MYKNTEFLSELDQNKCQDFLAAIVETFDRAWLEEPGRHPLQQLWMRNDQLAIMELVTFGSDLVLMLAKSPQWTSERIRKIKYLYPQSRGDLFELRCLSMFAAGGMEIIPATECYPGFDATVCFSDGHKVFISIKNHGMSNKERNFRQSCKELREYCTSLFSANFTNRSIGIFSKENLRDCEWKLLRGFFSDVSQEKIDCMKSEVAPGLVASISSLHTSYGDFSKHYYSDLFVFACQYHSNEQNNLKQKLNEAMLNMKEQIPARTAAEGLMVFMRLHQTASIAELEDFARQLLNTELPGCDGFVLYQPRVVHFPDLSFRIVHFVRIVARESTKNSKYKFSLNTQIGGVSYNQPNQVLTLNGIVYNFDGCYAYHAGDFFFPVTETDGGIAEVTCRTLESGIFTHGVIEDAAVKMKIVEDDVVAKISIRGNLISGIFPPDDELLLI